MSIPRMPMLAETIESLDDLANLQMPLWLSRKEDGIRGISEEGGGLTRTLKPIPNDFIHFSLSELPPGIEGEIITKDSLGNDDEFEEIESKVMSKQGEPVFQFRIFDWYQGKRYQPYFSRHAKLVKLLEEKEFETDCYLIPQRPCDSIEDIKFWYNVYVDKDGAEGVMLRDPNGFYKFGRSTFNEQFLLKLKPWNTDEAVVLDVLEEFENQNEKLKDERGLSKRSKHSVNLKGKGTMGKLLVKSKKFGEFKIGSGWTEEEKQRTWEIFNSLHEMKSTKLQYRYRGVSKYNKPKHTSFLKWL